MIINSYKWLFQRLSDQPCESSSPSGAKACKALEEPRHFQLLSSARSDQSVLLSCVYIFKKFWCLQSNAAAFFPANGTCSEYIEEVLYVWYGIYPPQIQRR